MSKIRLYGNTSGYIELAAPDVSDDATLTLPTGAAGFVPGNGGIGSNVVQDYETATFTTTSATYVDISNLSVSITLASASSKVLLMFNAEYYRNQTANQISDMQFSRGGTGVGPEVETRTVDTNNLYNGAAMMYLDSPAAVGPHTYTVQTKVSGGTADFRGTVLIAIEVAG